MLVEAPFEHRRMKEWKLSDDPYSYLTIDQLLLVVQSSRQRTNGRKQAVYIFAMGVFMIMHVVSFFRDHECDNVIDIIKIGAISFENWLV